MARFGLVGMQFHRARAVDKRILRALQAPLPELRFCPTGGIDSAKAEEYLALPNVPCVGGSWPVPAAAVRAGNWDRIEALAHAAASLRANPAA